VAVEETANAGNAQIHGTRVRLRKTKQVYRSASAAVLFPPGRPKGKEPPLGAAGTRSVRGVGVVHFGVRWLRSFQQPLRIRTKRHPCNLLATVRKPSICYLCRNAVNCSTCAGLPIRNRCVEADGQGHLPAISQQLHLPLAAPQACVAKASISTSSVPQGRLHCVLSSVCRVGKVSGWRGSVSR
jgi:hypothetical protein